MWDRLRVFALIFALIVVAAANAKVAIEPTPMGYDYGPTRAPVSMEAWPPSASAIGQMALDHGLAYNMMGDHTDLAEARHLTAAQLAADYGLTLDLPPTETIGLATLNLWSRHTLGWYTPPPSNPLARPGPSQQMLIAVYRDPATGYVQGRMALLAVVAETPLPQPTPEPLQWSEPFDLYWQPQSEPTITTSSRHNGGGLGRIQAG
jgi:hypothetical protein